MISLTSSLSLKLYLNSLVYHRNIFGSSSKVFENLRPPSEIFGNSRKMFGKFVWPSEQFWKILGNLRKVVGNLQKIIKNAVISTFIKEHYTLARRYEFYVLVWQEQYLTSERSERVRYCSCQSNIKFISFRRRVISSI